MKRTRLRPTGVGRRSTVIQELDDLAKTVLMLRLGVKRRKHIRGNGYGWYGPCQWCRCERWLQACHIHGKGAAPHMRFDPDNLFAACQGCHLFKWHKDPSKAEEFIVALLGEKARAALRLRSKQRGKSDRAATRLWLEQQVKTLGG